MWSQPGWTVVALPPFEVIYIDSGSKELQHQYNVSLEGKKNTEINEEIRSI